MATHLPSLGSRIVGTCAAAGMTVAISSCSWNEDRTATIGGVLGGVAGAVAGSQVGGGIGKGAAIAVGAALGAMLGQDLARNLPDVDKIFHERTTKDALEYGKPGDKITWSNPDTGNAGAVQPGETFKNEAGEECRQFETTVQNEGKEQITTGTACRTPEGEWKVVEQPA